MSKWSRSVEKKTLNFINVAFFDVFRLNPCHFKIDFDMISFSEYKNAKILFSNVLVSFWGEFFKVFVLNSFYFYVFSNNAIVHGAVVCNLTLNILGHFPIKKHDCYV